MGSGSTVANNNVIGRFVLQKGVIVKWLTGKGLGGQPSPGGALVFFFRTTSGNGKLIRGCAVANNFSHVARIILHAARIIRHVARIIHHAARIIRHMSRIIRHPAKIIRQTARIIRHMPRIIRQAARIIRHAARIICQVARIIPHAARIIHRAARIIRHAARIIHQIAFCIPLADTYLLFFNFKSPFLFKTLTKKSTSTSQISF